MIKQYWQSKSLKEKKMIAILALFSIACILYFICWMPLHNVKSELLSEIQDQRQLIAWMQEKAPQLANRKATSAVKNPKEIFSIIEETFKNQETLFPNLAITRNSETKVTITFNDIPFDAFINQLIFLKNKHQIDVEEAQINKLEKIGFVEGRVILESQP